MRNFGIMNLNQTIISQIIEIVKIRKKVHKLVLFGSRATNNARWTSDIDLAVFGNNLSDADLNLIKDDLEEKVKTPLKFDVVHFDALKKESLKSEILKEGIVIYESKKD